MIDKIKKLFQNRNPIVKAPNREFIFVHINKTAGTSILNSLNIVKKQHFNVKEIIDKIGEEKWNSTYKFSFVRNPWDKVVSHYHYRIKSNQNNMKENPIEFNDWVKAVYSEEKDLFYFNNPRMFITQSEWLKDYNGEIKLDRIGKFENLEEDFKLIQNDLGLLKPLEHKNKTIRKSYREMYTDETACIILKVFEEDIKRFNYTF